MNERTNKNRGFQPCSHPQLVLSNTILGGLMLVVILGLWGCEEKAKESTPEAEAQRVAALYCQCSESASKARTQEQVITYLKACTEQADKTFEMLLSEKAGVDMELQMRLRKAYKSAVDSCATKHKQVRDAAGDVAFL